MGKERERNKLGHDPISPWLLSFSGMKTLYRLRSGSRGKARAMEKGSREGGRHLAAPLVPGLHAIPMAHAELTVWSEHSGKAAST